MTEKNNKLMEAIKLINKEFGDKDTGDFPIILGKKKTETFHTGSIALDYASNTSGFPNGRIYEFFGAEASGKTTGALKIAAEYLKQGLSVVYIDAEGTLDPQWAGKLGVNIEDENFVLVQTPKFEEIMKTIRIFAEANAGLIIVDSVAWMVEEQALRDEEVEGKGMPLFAKKFRAELKKLGAVVLKTRTNLIFINHVMQDIGKMGYGDKSTTPGGTALKFASSMRLKFARLATEKDKDGKKIANRVKVTFVKNKVGAPYGEGEFTLNFKNGWDDVQEIIDYAVTTEVIVKESPRLYTYEGQKIATTTNELRKFIEEDETRMSEIKEKIFSKMKEEN